LYAALAIALAIRYRGFDLLTFKNHLLPFTIIYLFWIIVFYIHNLYDLDIAKNNAIFYSALLRALLINVAFTIAFFYFAPLVSQITIAPKTNLFLTTFVFIVLSLLWRNIFNRFAGSTALNINTAVIGHNLQVLELAKEIIKNPQLGYRINLIIKHEENGDVQDSDKLELKNIETKIGLDNLREVLVQRRITTAIVAPEIYRSPELIQSLFDCLRHKIDFINLPGFYEKIAQKVPVSAINQIWFLENISQRQRRFYEFSKRFFDFFAAIALLIISLPLWPLIALIIKLESPGPVFYKQIRTGQGGKSFKVIKFRSMIKDAEKDGPKMAQKNDPRVTKFGRFLRKSRFDELPQLWNVIKGEMSFIGPRAERPEFHEELKRHIPFYQERYLIKPGLSGWAQIKYGYSSSIEDNFEKIQYDLFYIKNRSFFFDLGIILKTINIILRGGGR
jgi:exopolysaccharide biosynthesis polyprenyl glycosylphosphotransferase